MAKRAHNPAAGSSAPTSGYRATERGFTLLEVLVATALMGIAIVGLLSLVNRSVANAAAIQQYDRAAMLARTQMDELLAMDPLPLDRGLGGTFDDTAGWSASIRPHGSLERGGRMGRSILVEVALTVHWQDRGERRQVQLEGYRRLKITPAVLRQLEDMGAIR